MVAVEYHLDSYVNQSLLLVTVLCHPQRLDSPLYSFPESSSVSSALWRLRGVLSILVHAALRCFPEVGSTALFSNVFYFSSGTPTPKQNLAFPLKRSSLELELPFPISAKDRQNRQITQRRKNTKVPAVEVANRHTQNQKSQLAHGIP